MTTLRDLIDEAAWAISRYKSPDVRECKERLSEVLEAAGLGSISHDCLESIDECDGHICIETSWTARGCSNTSSFRIPASIVDADDPVRAATEWGLRKKIATAQGQAARARADLERAEGESA